MAIFLIPLLLQVTLPLHAHGSCGGMASGTMVDAVISSHEGAGHEGFPADIPVPGCHDTEEHDAGMDSTCCAAALSGFSIEAVLPLSESVEMTVMVLAGSDVPIDTEPPIS